MNSIRGLLVLQSLLVIPAPALASAAGGPPQTIFECSLGNKKVSITQVGSSYIYAHGPPSHPEIEVIGDRKRKNVFVGGLTGSNGSGTTYFRLANGHFSYVVFWSGYGWDRGAKAVRESGLAAFDETTRISLTHCKSGTGFRWGWDQNGGPPFDPLSDKITDALPGLPDD